ncbi:MAG TPA: hypothetical protein VGM05_20380 [Planctomycetaceae bacterium]
MVRVLRLVWACSFVAVLAGCGGGADAKKETPPVTPEAKANLEKSHAETVKNQTQNQPAGQE